MSLEATLETLQADVHYFKDRAEVLDVVARHDDRCDRDDVDLIMAANHEYRFDEHACGNVSGSHPMTPPPTGVRSMVTRRMPRST